MRKLLLVFIILTLVLAGITRLAQPARDQSPVSAYADLLAFTDSGSYARAVGPYPWQFPADHGSHPDYQTEWWYYTGSLTDTTGRRFGFQFTLFRRAISPDSPETLSEWRTNQMYMAHFTLTDVTANQFYHYQRLSRGAADLAGATSTPRYRVWLDNWRVDALTDDASILHLTAAEGTTALDLTLEQTQPPALQGDNGLSAKGSDAGNASYYYSLSRLLTTGTITIEGAVFTVSGTTWMDHEFSTSALGPNVQGWDWFGLHLDDKRDLMIGQIRLLDGKREPAFGGLLIEPDGSTRYLPSDLFQITPTDTWTSPHTGTTYPATWTITIDLGGSEPLQLEVTPLIADQELVEDAIIYWEGAVRIEGDATGYGYAELTGYFSAMQGRF